MTYFQFQTDPYAFTMVWSAAVLALILALIVLVERGLFAWGVMRRGRLERLATAVHTEGTVSPARPLRLI